MKVSTDTQIDAAKEIERLLQSSEHPEIVGADGRRLPLTEELRTVLLEAAGTLARGDRVASVAVTRDLTTQAAADLLGVSRPYLISLLESGQLPFHKTGSHRRVALADLLRYKKERDRTRRGALRDLTQESQKLGLYDM
jgi:excisionase family DNA binding protein